MTAPVKANLSADGTTISLSKGEWSETFPIKQLKGRIDFYTRLRDHEPSKGHDGRPYDWPGIYGPTVVALERVRKLASVMGAT